MTERCPNCKRGIPKQPLVAYIGRNPYPPYSYCPYCGENLDLHRQKAWEEVEKMMRKKHES